MAERRDYHVTIIGSPSCPRGDDGKTLFTAEAVGQAKALGFRAIQVNIAWGARPAGEPLNLEDVVALPGEPRSDQVRRWGDEIRRRAALCHAAGVRAIFHFGAPRIRGTLYKAVIDPEFVKGQNVTPCILGPETVERYTGLLSTLATECPDVDDVLMYTYDQEAWICGEFGTCPRCRGTALHERLPGFLLAMGGEWERRRSDGRLFWEPWELSAGQVYRAIDTLKERGPGRLGLMLHGNIAEVMVTHSADPWFRNAARLAAEAGMPVVAETFLSSATEEVEPLQHVAAPRLVYESIRRLRDVPGVVGIKEYYGASFLGSDVNLEMAGLAFREPELPLDAALERLAAPYGPAATEVLAGWESAARGMAFFPWDLCWKFRHNAASPPVHSWDAFWFDGHLCDSPSWCSTRRTVFMLTEREPALHSWLIEDISLRWGLAAESFDRAIEAYEAAANAAPVPRRKELALWADDLGVLARQSRNFWRHTQETLLARTMRLALRTGAGLEPGWITRMKALLAEDVAAQAPYLDERQRAEAHRDDLRGGHAVPGVPESAAGPPGPIQPAVATRQRRPDRLLNEQRPVLGAGSRQHRGPDVPRAQVRRPGVCELRPEQRQCPGQLRLRGVLGPVGQRQQFATRPRARRRHRAARSLGVGLCVRPVGRAGVEP